MKNRSGIEEGGQNFECSYLNERKEALLKKLSVVTKISDAWYPGLLVMYGPPPHQHLPFLSWPGSMLIQMSEKEIYLALWKTVCTTCWAGLGKSLVGEITDYSHQE